MSFRKIKKLTAIDYMWMCDECGKLQHERSIPKTPDLTCQDCGANYTNGGGVHNHAKDPNRAFASMPKSTSYVCHCTNCGYLSTVLKEAWANVDDHDEIMCGRCAAFGTIEIIH